MITGGLLIKQKYRKQHVGPLRLFLTKVLIGGGGLREGDGGRRWGKGGGEESAMVGITLG